MLLRAALLVALLVAPTGCASAPASTKLNTGDIHLAAGQKRRRLRVATPTVTARPSEQESVLEEVPDPESARRFQKDLADPAVTLTPTPTPPKVTEIALSDTARGEAVGMRPAEGLTSAKLTEGQRAMLAVTLAPNECATFIAQGGLGVADLEMFLIAADRSDGIRILAQEAAAGPIALIGGRGRCYKNPLDTPLAAELHVTLRRGAGVSLVRGYRK